jgi:hypothetical protein
MECDCVCCSPSFQSGCQIWPATCLDFDRPAVHHLLLLGLFCCSVCNSSLNCVFNLHPFSHIFYVIFFSSRWPCCPLPRTMYIPEILCSCVSLFSVFLLHFRVVLIEVGARGGAVGWALLYKAEGRRLDSQWCHWSFSWTYSFRLHYGRGVDSSSKRNEYQEYFLGVKVAGA